MTEDMSSQDTTAVETAENTVETVVGTPTNKHQTKTFLRISSL